MSPQALADVTFLFTDIEGSTRRWEAHPAAMRAALAQHDAIMRDAIESHGGSIFKTVGDAFYAAFDSAHDAVAAALAAQQALRQADFATVGGLPVRMALNTGAVEERAGDYFGPALNRVARLLAIGYGGQVLLSADTAQRADGALPPEAGVKSLGAHQLRDLSEPETVYQLVAPALEHDFPPLRSRAILSNNLPAEPSSFVGRREETETVARLLREGRLVSVVGPGGMGKTRLAVHVATTLAHDWPDGVWFADLSAISEPALVPGAVASATGVHLAPDEDPIAALTAGLARKRTLLVLDNCEQVIDATARIASAILRECPNVALLASSRQPLAVRGESVVRIGELALPPQAGVAGIGAERARRYDAVALFEARAADADHRFALTDENAQSIAVLCRRLDGIPLAIELAAARVRAFGPRGVLERLDRRFGVLVSRARDASERQQTLAATIDWSYGLLTERERTMFRRLGVFVGGFTARAAAFVGADPEMDEEEALDLLASLDDKSLIAPDRDSEDARFSLLETMRAYALLRLEEAGESPAVSERHAQYMEALCSSAERAFMESGNDSAYTRALASEISDVRAALAWSLARGDAAAGATIAAAIARPWSRLGLSLEGAARVEAFTHAVPPAQPTLLSRLWTSVAWLRGSALRNVAAYEAAAQAVRYGRACGDAATLAWALVYQALCATRLRRFDEAQTAIDEARRLQHDPPMGQRVTELEVRAFLAHMRGAMDSAAAAYDEYLALTRSIGDHYAATNTVVSLAEVEHARGNTRRATELVRSVLPVAFAQLGAERYAGTLANLAGYLLAEQQVEEAVDAADEAIATMAERDPTSAWLTDALEHKALALALRGENARAARLEGYCEAAFATIGLQRETTERVTHERLIALLKGALSKEALAALLAQGAAMDPAAALAEAR